MDLMTLRTARDAETDQERKKLLRWAIERIEQLEQAMAEVRALARSMMRAIGEAK